MQSKEKTSNKEINALQGKNTKAQEHTAANIGISDKKVASSAMMLNILLADEMVLYTKTRNYHWNVEGMQFIELHKLFEEQYDQLAESIDEIAERIRQLGHYAVGSMKGFLAITNLEESDDNVETAAEMLRNLVNDHEAIIRYIRENIDKTAEDFNDIGTSDFITGLMEQHEKMAWMLRAHLG